MQIKLNYRHPLHPCASVAPVAPVAPLAPLCTQALGMQSREPVVDAMENHKIPAQT